MLPVERRLRNRDDGHAPTAWRAMSNEPWAMSYELWALGHWGTVRRHGSRNRPAKWVNRVGARVPGEGETRPTGEPSDVDEYDERSPGGWAVQRRATVEWGRDDDDDECPSRVGTVPPYPVIRSSPVGRGFQPRTLNSELREGGRGSNIQHLVHVPTSETAWGWLHATSLRASCTAPARWRCGPRGPARGVNRR